MMHHLYRLLIEPRTPTEDTRRREFILNILLLGTITLSLAAFLVTFSNNIVLAEQYQGSPPLLLAAVLIFFCGLYFLSRIKFYLAAAYIFVFIYFLLGTYVLIKWGIQIPQGLLMFAMVIVMAGILVSTRFAFVTAILTGISLFGTSYLHSNGIISPDLSWSKMQGNYTDATVFLFTLGVILLVSWLSNREIEKSLDRARRSEAALQKERDLLEVKVEERTRELKQIQLERISQLYKFAEIGQLASGIIHDLANPLATVSFNLERLSETERSNLVKRALKGTDYMKQFIQSARKQMQNQESNTPFSLNEEIKQVIQMHTYKARKNNVELLFNKKTDPKMVGNAPKFDQLIANMISNAIDAYAMAKQEIKDKKVVVSLDSDDNHAVITVMDRAGGIAKGTADHIFEPFFTTKTPEHGTGIGLAMCKKIVEKDFKGTISFSSDKEKGTVFSVKLPLQTSHDVVTA